MTKKEALKILKSYNDWRRGAEIPQPCHHDIGEALDVAIEVLERVTS